MNKQILIILALLLVVPLCYAALDTIEPFDNITLIQTCNNCTYCNVTTIRHTNGTTLLSNIRMTKDDTYYDYDLRGENLTTYGTYKYCYDCGNEITRDTGCINFGVTPTGHEVNEGQGITSIGIIIGMILLAGLFGFFGFKLSESDKLFPIALFFLVVSILIGVFTMQLAYISSRDILFPLATDGLQFKILLGVTWGLLAVVFIGLLFFIVKVLKEFKARKSIQNDSDGYDGQNK